MSMFSNFGYRAMYFGFWDLAKKMIKDYDDKSFFVKFCVA